MSALIKRFGDFHTELVKEYVDDEYQEKIENQSNTVFVSTLPYTLYSMGAVLAWTIPGVRSLLSLLVFFPLLIGIAFGQGWSKHYAPRPKPIILSGTLAIVVVLELIQGVGILYNVVLRQTSNFELFPLLIGGAIAGGLLGAFIGGTDAVKKMNRVRASDTAHLEAELED